ncbi:MAG: protein kinase [Planctomycetaceae bacterium]|nr:protein kinase [Planctomycetaceae bacterium]
MTHPTHDQLAAFETGRLGDDDSAVVEQHLAACADCCQWLKQSSGNDSYVVLLRDAASASVAKDAATNQPTVLVDNSETDAPRDASVPVLSEDAGQTIAGLPSELVNHPRYRMIRSLGCGGMGAVFEAEHRLMRRQVALKIIKPQWLANPEAVTRFRREMQAAAKLVHPHVVTAFDAEQAGDVHFLAMEFVDGVNLAELVAQRGPLPVEMACECIRQAALGLQHAHENGLVHRDLKPGNLMVSREPNLSCKILDFGLARFASEGVDGTDTTAGVLLGTPDFMAPEQARNSREADVRSDLYSLGCTLYFLLTGEVPHPGAKTALERALAHAERAPQLLATFRGDIPQTLQQVLDRLLAKRPEDRFQTPAELAVALEPFVAPLHRVRHNVVMALSIAPTPDRPLAAGLKRVLMAAGFVGFVLVMAVIVQVVTDKGALHIRSVADGVVLLLCQGDRAVWRIDVGAGDTVKRLPSGEYALKLKDPPSDLRLSSATVVLSRGRSANIVVSRQK